MQPEISFIIPAYHAERFLGACLDSLLAVRVPKEIIVIDDGSIKHTRAIART